MGMARARNPICPRCGERDKAPGQGYCRPCRAWKKAGSPMPVIKDKAQAEAAVQVVVARRRRVPEQDPGPVKVGDPLRHAPLCQCLPCRSTRARQDAEAEPRWCSIHKVALPCRRCGA